MKADEVWEVGTKVHVTRGTHAGKHGDVLSHDKDHQRVTVCVNGFGAFSVPTGYCKRETVAPK